MSDGARELFLPLMEEVFNRGNFDVADDLVADDFFNHEAPESLGSEGFKATARWLREAFPGLSRRAATSASSTAILPAARLVVSGTHRGPFMRRAGYRTVLLGATHPHRHRIKDGKLTEHWACRDDLGQLRQLGHAS